MGKSRKIQIDGMEFPSIKEAAERYNIDVQLVRQRLYILKWSVEKAFKTKVNPHIHSIIVNGIEFGSVNLNSDGEMLYYGIIGALSISIPKKEEEYMNILSKIEKE